MRVQAYGRNGSSFEVKVVCSDKYSWIVSACNTRSPEAMIVNVDTEVQAQAQAGVPTEGMIVHEDDDIVGEEGTTDNNDDTIEDNTDTNKSGHTPFKSRWLIPLLNTALAETPNMSNKHIKLLLAPYIKKKFFVSEPLAECKDSNSPSRFWQP